MAEVRGTIAQLWRYPVKSMQGEQVDQVELDASGVARDRRFGVIDATSGRVLSAKRWPALLEATARAQAGTVVVTLPGGGSFDTSDPAIDAALSEWLGLPVRLGPASADAGATYEMGSDPTDDDAETFEFTGPAGSFADLAAAHLLTTASLSAARELHPDGQWEVRRFRPTALVEGAGDGFAEDAWVGSMLRAGSVDLNVVMPTVRCAMPARAQPGGLRRDLDIARTVNHHHDGNLGVYCWVVTAGTIAVGDPLVAA